MKNEGSTLIPLSAVALDVENRLAEQFESILKASFGEDSSGYNLEWYSSGFRKIEIEDRHCEQSEAISSLHNKIATNPSGSRNDRYNNALIFLSLFFGGLVRDATFTSIVSSIVYDITASASSAATPNSSSGGDGDVMCN